MIDEQLVQMACFSADFIAMQNRDLPEAKRVEAIVRRVLEALEANGCITVTPLEDRDLFYTPAPPYSGEW